MSNSSQENAGYRRGVVLGLTIAEIILLILFALLLALTGVLMNKRNATIVEVESRMASQQLPPSISNKLTEMGINLANREGENRLLSILNSAETDTDRQKALQQAMQLGLDVQKNFGKTITAEQLLKTQIELKNQIDLMKADQAKSGNGQILPPCYQTNKSDPVPFIFEFFVRNDALVMKDVTPERLRSRFDADFKGITANQSFTSDREFIAKTRPFADYGKRNHCKFYVKVYDETTGNSKERVRGQLKLIENTFVWTFMMAGKAGDKEDISLFPVAPTQLK